MKKIIYFFIFFQVSRIHPIPIQNIIDGQSALKNGISQLEENIQKSGGFIENVNQLNDSINNLKDFFEKMPSSIIGQLNASKNELKEISNDFEKDINILFNTISKLAVKNKLNISKNINNLKNNILNNQLSMLLNNLEKRRSLFIQSIKNNLSNYLSGKKNVLTDFTNEIQSEADIAKKFVLNFKNQVIGLINKQIPQLKDVLQIKQLIDKDFNNFSKKISNFYDNLKNFLNTNVKKFLNYANTLNNSFTSLGQNLLVLNDNLIQITSGGIQLASGTKDFPLIPGLPATIIPTPLYTALSNVQNNLTNIRNILETVKSAGAPTITDIALFVSNLIVNIVTSFYKNPVQIPYAAASILTATNAIQKRVNSLQESSKSLENTINDLKDKANSVNVNGIISNLKDLLHSLSDILQNDINESLIFVIDVVETFKNRLKVDLLPPAIQSILLQLKHLTTSLSANLEFLEENIELIGVSVGVEIGEIILILTASMIGIYKFGAWIKKTYDYSKYKEQLKKELKELGFTDEQIKEANIPDQKSYKEIVNSYEEALKTGKASDMNKTINKLADALQKQPEEVFSTLKENLSSELRLKLEPVFEEPNIVLNPSNITDLQNIQDLQQIEQRPIEQSSQEQTPVEVQNSLEIQKPIEPTEILGNVLERPI